MTIKQLSLYSLLLTTPFIQGAQDPANRRQRDEAFRNASVAFQECQKALARLIVETPEGRQLALECRSNSDTFDPRTCQLARLQLAKTKEYEEQYVSASDKFRDLSKTFENIGK